MRMKYAQCLCGIAIALSGVASMRAQDVRIMHFKGVINDYSPSTVSGGPWGIRGVWTLDVEPMGTANFSADLTIETSDYWISDTTKGIPTLVPGDCGAESHAVSFEYKAVEFANRRFLAANDSYGTRRCRGCGRIPTANLIFGRPAWNRSGFLRRYGWSSR